MDRMSKGIVSNGPQSIRKGQEKTGFQDIEMASDKNVGGGNIVGTKRSGKRRAN